MEQRTQEESNPENQTNKIYCQIESQDFFTRNKMSLDMSELSKQESLVIMTNRNGRVEYELNHNAIKDASKGIVIGDLYGYISDVNDTIVKIFGAKNKNEFVGKHILEFLVKEEKVRAIQSSLASIATNQGMTQQYRVQLRSGKETTVEVTTTFIKDETGENIGFIDFVREIN